MINGDKGHQQLLAPPWTTKEKQLPPNVKEWLVRLTERWVAASDLGRAKLLERFLLSAGAQ